jgi:DNA-binding Xre family transcriptional regulator
MQTIGEVVRINLVLKKMSINTFCDEIGISDVALRKLFSRNDCKISMAVKMCQLLEIDIKELIQSYYPNEKSIGEEKLITAMQSEIDYLKSLLTYNNKFEQ